MIAKTIKLKPKNAKNKETELKDVLCDIDTGYHCCFATSKTGDLNKYGIGVSLYFKFIKYLAVFFATFSMITMPILILTFRSDIKKILFNT